MSLLERAIPGQLNPALLRMKRYFYPLLLHLLILWYKCCVYLDCHAQWLIDTLAAHPLPVRDAESGFYNRERPSEHTITTND